MHSANEPVIPTWSLSTQSTYDPMTDDIAPVTNHIMSRSLYERVDVHAHFFHVVYRPARTCQCVDDIRTTSNASLDLTLESHGANESKDSDTSRCQTIRLWRPQHSQRPSPLFSHIPYSPNYWNQTAIAESLRTTPKTEQLLSTSKHQHNDQLDFKLLHALRATITPSCRLLLLVTASVRSPRPNK